jgi:hypothetical protein
MGEKFFVRGNLALDWEHVIYAFPAANYVAVDLNGSVYAHKELPATTSFGTHWISDDYSQLGIVGERCIDWYLLIFKRQDPPMLPEGFWEAVDIFCGEGYDWFYFKNDVHPVVSKILGDERYEEYVNGLTHIKPAYNATRRPYLRIGQTEAD